MRLWLCLSTQRPVVIDEIINGVIDHERMDVPNV
jgi:hypothetical protein